MAKNQYILDTQNRQQICMQTPYIKIQLLGSVDTDNLDALSVTLKISKRNTEQPPLRSSLDLYLDEQMEELLNKLCQKFELGFSETQSALYALTEQLEDYRFSEIENKNQFSKTNTLSLKEERQAKRYLGKQNIISSIKEDLKQAGVHNNLNQALLLYLSLASRKTNSPLQLAFMDDTDVSKQLFEVIKTCIPTSDYMYPSSISAQALYYLGLEDFKHKTLFLSDFGKKQEIYQPLSELITHKRLKKIVALKDRSGLPYAMSPEMEGPINLNVIAKTKYKPKLSKLPVLIIDLEHTLEQMQSWHHAKKLESAGLVDIQKQKEAQERLRHIQSTLQNINVINPYAIDIELPKGHKTNTKLLEQVLNFIKTITYLHQIKREHYVLDGFNNPCDPYIKTSSEDIELAFELLKPVLETKARLLTKATETFYQFLQKWLQDQNKEEFQAYQIRQHKPEFQKRSLNRYLKELLENGLIVICSGKKHTGYIYAINKQEYTSKINAESDIENKPRVVGRGTD